MNISTTDGSEWDKISPKNANTPNKIFQSQDAENYIEVNSASDQFLLDILKRYSGYFQPSQMAKEEDNEMFVELKDTHQ